MLTSRAGSEGGDTQGSESEYAKNDKYLTPPQEGEDCLVPIDGLLPPLELTIYAPDNNVPSDVEVYESVRDGEFEHQVMTSNASLASVADCCHRFLGC